MNLRIKQRHIDNGVKSCSERCPISLALVENGCIRPNVGIQAIGFDVYGKRVYCNTPDDAQQFISDFDNGRTVQPRVIELESRRCGLE